jgi:signal peptidase I
MALRPSWSRPYFGRLLALVVILFGLRTFVGEASVVPTGSMEHTVLIGDHILLDKFLYGPEIPLTDWRLPRWKTVRRGDIVVFRYPRDPSQTFIKRVAAVGGDRLEIRDGVVYLNSRRIVEPYAVHQRASHRELEHIGPMVVPPNCLFVMGDNRDNSSDSRDWGFVPVDNVIGEPMFVYWSYDAPSADWLERSFARRLAFDASIAGNFFSRTRWNRIGLRF